MDSAAAGVGTGDGANTRSVVADTGFIAFARGLYRLLKGSTFIEPFD